MLNVQRTTVTVEGQKETANATYLVLYSAEGNNLQNVTARVQVKQLTEQPNAEGGAEMVETLVEIGTIEMFGGFLRVMNFPYSANTAKYMADFVEIVNEITAPAVSAE